MLVPLLSAIVIVLLSYWGWRQIEQSSDEFQQAMITAEQAKARAEKVSLAKDNFLGTISHELRNPLNSIMLWSSTLLTDQTLDDHVRRGLAAIDRAVRVQTQLVDDLLDLARIESGRMRLDVQSVDLAEVVQAAVESMRAAAEAKSITLQEIIDSRVGPLAGDAGRLQQVVWNLLSNAVKFTPKEGKIQVRVERVNSHVELIVADTGQGIDPASLDSVFYRFWQAEDRGQSKLGVGLGLSIVKEIVSLHGGTVSANSEGPGKGSTFIMKLPMPISTLASTELRRHPTVAPAAGAANAPRLDGFSILVVDDDPNACEALENLLTSLGARVTAATSAQAALAMLDQLRPDAVVSDIGMPIHDGYFLARELRGREHAAGRDGRIPLIALTAYGRVEDKVKVFEAGFDNHMVKPVDPAELSAILSTVIASRGV
ncbi:MAG TPA: ATP-binding protein [Candidatus Binataceae bacterium]|nr:ATP-binding protein [Candidatus Binataceae bacterium]